MAESAKPRAPFAPWDRRELPGAFDVAESARRVGHYKWVEMKMFEALGGWVATVPELDVKMRLGTHCYKHAWHAELWHKRLPELREMNPDRLCVPANDAMVRFMAAMTEPEAPELTVEKLVGVYRVLVPRVIAAYTYHLNNTSEITDAPTIRSLKFALGDELDDWRDGEMLIQSLVDSPDAVQRAAAHHARLETIMVEAGGITGAGSIGFGTTTKEAVRALRKFFPVEDLARDERFYKLTMADRMGDPRSTLNLSGDQTRRSSNRLSPKRKDASDAARSLMHGIFVGEIQALEGAGRTCWDFPDVNEGQDDAIPFALKLDMARQAWDEARHVEISVKLSDWMGTEIGQYAENTVLFEAACSHDPVLRLAGVNRALEGLAIDVFTTMKEFGDLAGDPFLEFCEDWMLADEVTHVKMGSDWLRRLTETDPERRKKALEFQSVVDKLFSFGGTRSDSDESPIGLARRFRELAGFTDTEIDDIAEVSMQAIHERKAEANRLRQEAAARFSETAG